MHTRVLFSKVQTAVAATGLLVTSAATSAHTGPAHVHSDSMVLSAAVLGIAGLIAVVAVAKSKSRASKVVKGDRRNDA